MGDWKMTKATNSKVQKAVKKNAPFAIDMITEWITTSMLGNTHMVTALSNCRFTFKSTDKMRFTAKATIRTGREFDQEIDMKFIWTKNGDRLQAKFAV